ncbi:MAG: DUF370 domain-containing protein [Clostridiales bacterium]|nr:DUF370 domain-containing protein [Clostridiales bacterium]
MQGNLVSIGFGSVIHVDRLIAILNADSAPIRRKIQEAREKGLLVDASYGRKTRSVLIMDSGQVILSAILPETLTARIEGPDRPEESI